MDGFSIDPLTQPISRRAARRLIQRAFVLTGRDKHLRQLIRQVRLGTLWTLEDWDFSWTILLERGHLEFDRRPTKKPSLTFSWPTAQGFFSQMESESAALAPSPIANDPALRSLVHTLLRTFAACFREVLRDPVDEDGTPLA